MPDTPSRRRLLAGLAAAPLLAAARPPALSGLQPVSAALPALHPPRLREGDTIGLVSPAAATYEREPVEIAIEALQALGFRVKPSDALRARYGHLAGSDETRAAALDAMFADPDVAGIVALGGGSGCARILDRIDYAAIQRHPKVLCGYSDITALHCAIGARTGLVTFLGPNGKSEWNAFTVERFRRVLVDGEAAVLRNVPEPGASIVPTQDRIRTLRGGRAQGRLVGGNLTVLTALAGTPYWPAFDGAILVLEDVNEAIYRIDRMLSTLRLTGALARVAGVVLGNFTHCEPGDGYGTLTLDEVFDDHLLPLGVPVFAGAMFGHARRNATLPLGHTVAIDADVGSIDLLQPAVR